MNDTDTSDSETSQWPARAAITVTLGGVAFLAYSILRYVYESVADGLTAVEAGNIGMILLLIGLFLMVFFLHENHKGTTMWDALKEAIL